MEQNSRINIGPARLSYPNLFTPQAQEGSDKKTYNVCLLIPKENKTLIEQIKKAMVAAIPDELKKGGQLPKNFRLPLRDGDLEKADRQEYAGMLFMNAKSTMKPQCVKKVNGVFMEATQEELYPGVWAYANIHFYAYDKSGNKGLSASLNAVVKFRDDESFAGSAAPVDQLFSGLDIPDAGTQAAPAADDGIGDLPMDL